MAKLSLTDIAAGFESTTTINDNNNAIEVAVENTLSRDGTGPNQMEADLDMNSNRIINLGNAINPGDAVNLQQVNDSVLNSPVTLDGVGNVDTSTKESGSMLYFDGANWVDTGDELTWSAGPNKTLNFEETAPSITPIASKGRLWVRSGVGALYYTPPSGSALPSPIDLTADQSNVEDGTTFGQIPRWNDVSGEYEPTTRVWAAATSIPPPVDEGYLRTQTTGTVDVRRPQLWLPATNTTSTHCFFETRSSPDYGFYLQTSGGVGTDEFIIGAEINAGRQEMMRFNEDLQIFIDNAPLYLEERATADTDFTGYGQLWVKDDAPNTLYFTDDDGTDFPVSGAGITIPTIFTGYVTYNAVGNTLPAGWSAVNNAIGKYTITHNLGLSNVDDLIITGTPIGGSHNVPPVPAIDDFQIFVVHSRTANSFQVIIGGPDMGPIGGSVHDDRDFQFIAIDNS